jgi:hypothetical protein
VETSGGGIATEEVSSSRLENLSKIKNHVLSVLRQYEKEHAKKIEELIAGLLHQLNLLYQEE